MNSNERWERIKDIFEASLGRTGGERRAFLEGACGGDSAMVREVESLLASFDADYMEGAAVDEVADAFFSRTAVELKPGALIGQYKIVAELGKGGQGSVYKAFDSNLDRTVALKTLPSELTIDDTARKRFHREARLASALDHPNIAAIHDLAEAGGIHFIVMQLVDGKNIRELVDGKPLDLASALKICIQVCNALDAAHKKGIIHRDIKAHNIMVTADGTVKVLDFGLAKINREGSGEHSELTVLGSPYGTPTYAAPEQSRGEKVDHRADIFSTGVLLYEMLTGTWAFHGKTAIDVRHAVLHDDPKPVADRRGESIPASLDAIVRKALEKDAANRFADISQMGKNLISVLRELASTGMGSSEDFLGTFESSKPYHFVSHRKKAKRIAAVGLTLTAVIAVLGYFVYRHYAILNQAAADAVKVGELAKQRQYFAAYDLSKRVLEYRPNDESVLALMPTISDELSVTSNETGANVYLKRFAADEAGNFPARTLIGVTPIEKLQIARGDYVLEVEKEGFAASRRTISGSPEVNWNMSFNPPPMQVDVKLLPAGQMPENMVYVPGGKYRLVSWKKPTDSTVPLDDFFIDRFEVSNREFKEFVTAGGYLKRDYWKFPFFRDGKPLEWDPAMSEFKDRTGLPAPRNWVNQNFPEGRGDHPVTDISWYEAAAFAEFKGKSLPSVFQWEKAAKDGQITQSSGELMPWGFFQTGESLEYRANISGRDTLPVNADEFGMSPFGCYNMAGNAMEWCHNETTEGFATAGGSWGEPAYSFGSISAFPAFFSSNKLGFRCVKNLGDNQQDRSKIDTTKSIPVYPQTSNEKFAVLKGFYSYDHTPTNGHVIEVVESADWRREKIEYLGANDEMALAYLYLPKNVKPPFQMIEYMPAGDVYGRFATVPQHVEIFASSQIKAGRAVFAVVLKGFLEREYTPDRKAAPLNSVRFRDKLVNDAIDLHRGLDYLETRDDIDKGKIAYWGYSAGAEFGVLYTSLESRLKTAIFMAVGITRGSNDRVEEANTANFAPHIKVPKLIIIGRYDENYSWKTESEPLVKLLTEPKLLIQYDAGHTPPPEIAVPAISKWLDEKLGPVNR